MIRDGLAWGEDGGAGGGRGGEGFRGGFHCKCSIRALVDVEQGGLSSQDIPFPLLPQLLIVTTIPCLNESCRWGLA